MARRHVRRYRRARREAGRYRAEAEAHEKRFESLSDILKGYGERGRELAAGTAEQYGKLSPFLKQFVGGGPLDPRMGAFRLRSLAGVAGEGEGARIPSMFAMAPTVPAGQMASLRSILAPKREAATLDLTPEEVSQLRPMGETAATWQRMQAPISMTQTGARQAAGKYEKAAGKYKEAMERYAYYKRRHQKQQARLRSLGGIALGGLGTLLTMGALGPVAGALGAAPSTVGALGGASLGAMAPTLTSTLLGGGLGALGGGLAGGWRGALLGGLGAASPGIISGIGGLFPRTAGQAFAGMPAVGGGQMAQYIGGQLAAGGAGAAPSFFGGWAPIAGEVGRRAQQWGQAERGISQWDEYIKRLQGQQQ